MALPVFDTDQQLLCGAQDNENWYLFCKVKILIKMYDTWEWG